MYRTAKTALAAVVFIGSLISGAWSQDKQSAAQTPDFLITATRTGIPGLLTAAPGKARVVLRSNGQAPLLRLWGLSADSEPANVPAISLQLPDRIEAGASGHQVIVNVVARRAPGSSNSRFGVVYATNEVGNSGWQMFDLSDQLQSYSFTYDVKTIVDGNGDFIGFLPDPDGGNGAVDIAAISVSIVSAPNSDAVAGGNQAAAPQPPVTAQPPAAAAHPGAMREPPADQQMTSAASAQLPPPPGDIIATSYYDLKIRRIQAPDFGQRGGIARLGDGLLYGAQTGRLFYFPDLTGKSVIELGSRPPFDLSSPKLKFLAENTLTILGVGAEKRRRARADGWDIYESMLEFDDKRDCVTIGLWHAEITLHGRAAPSFDSKWERIFRSRPCLPLANMHHEAALQEGGGRIDFDRKGIVFSVGLGGFEEIVDGKESDDPARSDGQIDSSDYGKVIHIDRKTHAVSHIAKGVRNPEGLFVDTDGTIFETEHGPQGGDEINIIEQGKNYGWPEVTFGTIYGEKTWRYDSGPDAQSRFTAPLFAFVPSVGPSEIVRVHGDEFARWKGDLIMTSLTGGSSGTPQGMRLFRLHYVDRRILFSEPIYIGTRMRDIIEEPDGKLVISTDGAEIIIVSDAAKEAPSAALPDAADAQAAGQQPAPAEQPVTEQAMAPAAAPANDAVFAEKCNSCHGLRPGNPEAIAPALGCIFNGNVASTDSFAYSDGLKKKSSVVWDAKNLADFLKNPKSWAPGTRMEAPPLSDGQAASVIAFLSRKPAMKCR